ncbi:dihydrolipoamide dehydrogenase [Aminobacter aminovorans]|uniref:Dihydrolipoyl dehydrogenase n=1 Tax=Aminobacter aminovorans TaxID=83263 RepID=A0A381IJV6_AMIAI|nr:dihydrolipoyl dehydrogenase [Aminobacter aminovorans]TCS24834.1 dihydrolipoamide dehydrogenase [Aminobacter aminovorans]SUY28157.1 Dihydrolipoyl dehydrogenase [Aminobacter aminovorans]
MSITEIRVPEMGDFKEVAVIEVHIQPGDEVALDQTLIVLESDKASIDVPSPSAGRIASVELAIGQRVSKGALIAIVEAAAGGGEAKPAATHEAPAAVAKPIVAATPSPALGAAPDCDVLVIGGGPGGYSAAFRAADLGQRVILVERDATLGGVCLNVGCIPSKALLHVAAVKEDAERLADHGVAFDTPTLDLDRLRRFKTGVVTKLTDGLKGMARQRKVEVVRGTATFAEANAVDITLFDGASRRIAFAKAIVAAGSMPLKLPFLPDHPRIVDSSGALELPFIPERMLVIGGGIIGLEMATVYSALGARVDVVEQLDKLLPDVDRDVVETWRKRNAHRFDAILLGARVESVIAEEDALVVTTSGEGAGVRRYDLILQSAGRRPAAEALQLVIAGISLDAKGFIEVDAQMRTHNQNVFAVGDVTGNPMLAHKAVHQGHVAAEAATGLKSFMDAKVVPSVAYTDPEIAWVGVTEDAAKAAGRTVEVGKFPWAASGRAIANGADYGLTKLVFDKETHRIIGGAIVGPAAGDMIGEICLAIEMGADAVDIGKTIHPHPTLGETIGMAAEVAEGICTDLPPIRRKPA